MKYGWMLGAFCERFAAPSPDPTPDPEKGFGGTRGP